MKYTVHYECVSHIGHIRKINQDNFLCNNEFLPANEENAYYTASGACPVRDALLFGVFDGMGGEECGEVASYLAAKNAASFHFSDPKNTVSELLELCDVINEDICEFSRKNHHFTVGTTAAMLAFGQSKITLCNIGDSKVFRFHNGVLKQISKDHILEIGNGTKTALYQHLGIPRSEMIIEPYFAQGDCTYDDTYLICSDGLTDMVTTEQISKILTYASPGERAETLLKTALANGGKDNVTILICKIHKMRFWENFHHKKGGKEHE